MFNIQSSHTFAMSARILAMIPAKESSVKPINIS